MGAFGTPLLRQIALATTGNDRLLLCRATALEQWILPGGAREPGESDKETLTRELLEELGPDVSIRPGSLIFLGTFTGRAAGRTQRMVEIGLYGGAIDGLPRASSEICAIEWFLLDQVSDVPLSPVLEDVVFPFLRGSRTPGRDI